MKIERTRLPENATALEILLVLEDRWYSKGLTVQELASLILMPEPRVRPFLAELLDQGLLETRDRARYGLTECAVDLLVKRRQVDA